MTDPNTIDPATQAAIDRWLARANEERRLSAQYAEKTASGVAGTRIEQFQMVYKSVDGKYYPVKDEDNTNDRP